MCSENARGASHKSTAQSNDYRGIELCQILVNWALLGVDFGLKCDKKLPRRTDPLSIEPVVLAAVP